MQYSFLQAIAITIALETPVYVGLYPARPRIQVALLSVAFNLLTLPFVWFFFYPLITNYAAYFAVAESFAFLSEAGILFLAFREEGAMRALLASLSANAVSAGFGLILSIV